MSAWELKTLGELTSNHDAKRKAVKESDRKKGNYPYYGASGVVDFVDDYLFDGDFLLIAEDGENLKTRKTPIAFMVNGKFWVNNHAHIVAGNDLADTRYLQYAVQAADVNPYLTGAVMPKLTQGNLNNLLVPCPPIETQRTIAQLLGALDDKIALNRRMNATLEAMARALFKDWFVDFGPVRTKLAGSAPTLDADVWELFPSELGENGVPVGWEICGLGEMIEPKRGQTITRKTVSEGTIPVIAGGLSPAYYHNKANVAAPVITVSASGANAGFVQLHHDNIWASDCSYIDTNATKSVYATYVFLKIKQAEITKMQQGAAQPHVYPSDLKRMPFIKTTDLLIQAYERSVTPLFAEIAVNEKQSKTLATLRDTLLPKLLSGELSVDTALSVVKANT